MEESLALSLQQSTVSLAEKRLVTFGNSQKANNTSELRYDGYVGEVDTLGRPHGVGKLAFSDGSLQWMAKFNNEGDGVGNGSYKGEFREGLRHGQGRFRYADGRVFEGVWEHGMPREGTTTFVNGDVYRGEYARNGDKSGKGVYEYVSGALYEGYWLRNRRHGFGSYKDADGVQLGSGMIAWENGKPDLEVHENLYGGDRDAKTGLPNGHGAMRYTDGRIYEGQFVMGEPQGWGQMRYPASAGEFKGDVMYEGNFEAGLFHGEGTLWERWPKGRGYSRIGEDEDKNSTNKEDAVVATAAADGVALGAFCHPPGVVTYRGPFVHGARHGKRGIEDYPGTGEQYVGSFVDDQQSGHGVLFYAQEEVPSEEGGNKDGEKGNAYGKGKTMKKVVTEPTPPLDRNLALKAIRAAHATASALAQEVADAADPEAAVIRIAAEQEAEVKASKEALRKQRIGGGGGGRSRSESPDKKHQNHSGDDDAIHSPKGSPKKGHSTGSGKGGTATFSSSKSSSNATVVPKERVKKYEGEWLHGTFHGKGALWASNGAIFVGTFEKGLRQDENAVEVYADGSKYVGGFALDHRAGTGKLELSLTHAGGGSYEGQWAGGRYHGQGVRLFADGSSYRGAFEKGRYHGFGTMLYAKLDTTVSAELAPYVPFACELMALHRTPKAKKLHLLKRIAAVAKSENGGIATAGNADIDASDLGEEESSSGSSPYLPEHVEGLHGLSSELGLGGVASYVGWWEKGGKGGEGVEVFFDGSEYRGGFKHGQRHGDGRFVWAATGDVYGGSFEFGLMQGDGVYVYSRREGDGLDEEDSSSDDDSSDEEEEKGQHVAKADDAGYEGQAGDKEDEGNDASLDSGDLVQHATDAAGWETSGQVNDQTADDSMAGAPTDAETETAVAAPAPSPSDPATALRDPKNLRCEAAAQHQWDAPVDKRSRFFYDGQWKQGFKSGHGRFAWAGPGDNYVGEWRHDGRDGQGTFEHGDGRRYEGTFKHGWKEGYGVQTWGDAKRAARYEGTWLGGKMHGGGEGDMPVWTPPDPDAYDDPIDAGVRGGGTTADRRNKREKGGSATEAEPAVDEVPPLSELFAFVAKADAEAAAAAAIEEDRKRGIYVAPPPPKQGGEYIFSDGRQYRGGFWKGRPHCASGGEGITADGRLYHYGAWEFGGAVKFNPKGRRHPTLVAGPPWPPKKPIEIEAIPAEVPASETETKETNEAAASS